MLYYCVIVLTFFSLPLLSMFPHKSQLEFCPTRKMYDQKTLTNTEKGIVESASMPVTKPCVFCDKEILAQNYVLKVDYERDLRIMMNKFPYMDFDQGQQILIMPISHKEQPYEFLPDELSHEADVVQKLSAQLYEDAYTQEYFHNWGAMSGQSVAHWHGQFKNFVKPPMSLPDRMESFKNSRITNIEEAFKATQSILEQREHVGIVPQKETTNPVCLCCTVRTNQESDENNFVIVRLKHNYICLSHHPAVPGELSIVPHNHVASLKDLSPQALRENMIVTRALLPIMKDYAQLYIRECGGANSYIKSMGDKAFDKHKRQHHVHTRIMPRTAVPLTPGNFDNNSCKLDYDPLHLFDYLKNNEELKKVIT